MKTGNKLDQGEYLKRKDNIARSEAPVDAKVSAMKELDLLYGKVNPINTAHQQFLDSSPDTNDIGDHS